MIVRPIRATAAGEPKRDPRVRARALVVGGAPGAAHERRAGEVHGRQGLEDHGRPGRQLRRHDVGQRLRPARVTAAGEKRRRFFASDYESETPCCLRAAPRAAVGFLLERAPAVVRLAAAPRAAVVRLVVEPSRAGRRPARPARPTRPARPVRPAAAATQLAGQVMFTLVLVANMGDAPIHFRVVVGLIPAAVIGVNVALLVRFIKPQSALNMAEVSVV